MKTTAGAHSPTAVPAVTAAGLVDGREADTVASVVAAEPVLAGQAAVVVAAATQAALAAATATAEAAAAVHSLLQRPRFRTPQLV